MLNDESPSLAQQVKAMVIAERSKNFNLAFNHLLNCFHFYLYAEDPLRGAVKLKDYDQNAVIRLMSKRASIEDIQFAMSVFDRRNKNTISHPGEQGQENWAVDQEEYSFYKAGVIKLMMSGMSSQRYRNQVDVRV
jgi:hypothetical protein